jgi:hypothetical protein
MSFYDATVPVFLQMLSSLSGLLNKAEAYCKTKNIQPEVLLTSRLYPDMFPLSRQIQLASDFAAKSCARLAHRARNLASQWRGNRQARFSRGGVTNEARASKVPRASFAGRSSPQPSSARAKNEGLASGALRRRACDPEQSVFHGKNHPRPICVQSIRAARL